MTFRADDSDGKFINFTEAFRKAKRTSLSWSALTLFVAAAPAWTEDVRIAGSAIPYPQAALAALLFIIALFYFSGFLRELGYVSVQNSAAAEEAQKQWNSLINIIGDWHEKLAPISSEIEEAKERTGEILSFSKALRLAMNELEEAIKSGAARVENATKPMLENDALWTPEEETRDFKLVVELYRANMMQLSTLVGELQGFVQMEPQDTLQNILSRTADHNSTIDQLRADIQALEYRLNQFRSVIDEPEKRWHLWHDRVPVIVLFGLAFYATLGRIAFEYPFV